MTAFGRIIEFERNVMSKPASDEQILFDPFYVLHTILKSRVDRN